MIGLKGRNQNARTKKCVTLQFIHIWLDKPYLYKFLTPTVQLERALKGGICQHMMLDLCYA
jgi:hypothetical protein